MSDYAVVDPTTGETVETYPTITNDALATAIARAGEIHRTWSRTTSVADRAALISRVADLHVERQDTLAEIIAREMGKPLGDAAGEVAFSAAIYQFYADDAAEFLADEPITLMGGEGSAIVVEGPRRASRNHAVELPLLPGRSVRRPESHHRQPGAAQARSAMPRVGGCHRADLPRRWLPSRGLH